MKVVSIINYKGGVGKTSLTANLGAELAWRGHRVLLIDLDAQASLTFSFISPEEWRQRYETDRTIKAWFDAMETGAPVTLRDLVETPRRIADRIAGKGELDIIYSHLGLINVDLELALHLTGASMAQARRNFLAVHKRLQLGLSDSALQEEYDICLIDCPPNFNIVTKTAIVASDYILVPTKPDQLSTLGIDYLINSIQELVGDYNEFARFAGGPAEDAIDPKILGVVFTMIQEYAGAPISAQRAYMQKVRRESGLNIFDSYITHNTSIFADAPAYGVPVVLSATNNYTHQKVIAGLEQVATEFLRDLEGDDV